MQPQSNPSTKEAYKGPLTTNRAKKIMEEVNSFLINSCTIVDDNYIPHKSSVLMLLKVIRMEQ